MKISVKILEYFSSGVLVAIFVAIGSSWWTLHLMQQESIQREQAVELLLKDEIESNIAILKTNDELLQFDLNSIRDRRSLIKPLLNLETAGVEILRIQIPRKYTAKENQVLRFLHAAMIKAKLYNGTLQARDNHRTHLGQLKNYGELLENYDRALQSDGRDLLIKMQSLRQLL
jgi:hypothetical protein